jgi:hypothetical protein
MEKQLIRIIEQAGDKEIEWEKIFPTQETREWCMARVAELEERFGITSPALVAKALGISEVLARGLIQNRMSIPYKTR